MNDKIKRRVWAVCCVFTCLFFLLLIWPMFGCMDSQEQKIIDDVRIYEILPDGTKKEIVVLSSKGWEAREKEATQ